VFVCLFVFCDEFRFRVFVGRDCLLVFARVFLTGLFVRGFSFVKLDNAAVVSSTFVSTAEGACNANFPDYILIHSSVFVLSSYRFCIVISIDRSMIASYRVSVRSVAGRRCRRRVSQQPAQTEGIGVICFILTYYETLSIE
jgi:hypothetical protein